MSNEWKDIKFIDFNGVEYDYTGHYKINKLGDVYSYKSNRLLSKCKDKDGYCRAMLSKDGKIKTFKVHRLVAFMFIATTDKTKQMVNHRDENKENNHVSNLEWCTVSENNNYGTRQQRVHKQRRKTMSTEEWKQNNSGKNHKGSKKVVSVNIYDFTLKIYDSMHQASEEIGKESSSISKAITRKSVTSDCLWFKEEEYHALTSDEYLALSKLIECKKQRYLKYYKH